MAMKCCHTKYRVFSIVVLFGYINNRIRILITLASRCSVEELLYVYLGSCKTNGQLWYVKMKLMLF